MGKAGKTPGLVRVGIRVDDRQEGQPLLFRIPGGVSSRPPARPEPQAKKVRRKPAQARVHVALREHFPPDGKVPDETSTEAVRLRIGRQHQWDTVNRALGRA